MRTQKKVKAEIPKAARAYDKQLRKETNPDREKYSKKPFDDDPPDTPVRTKTITVSSTDSESGMFH